MPPELPSSALQALGTRVTNPTVGLGKVRLSPLMSPYPAGMENLYRRWEWAEGHIDVVCREVSSFLLKQPCEIDTEDDPQGNRTFRARVIREVPHQISLLVGDTLQALRSPLDNAAWSIALKQAAAPPDVIHFPIAKTMQSWNSIAGTLRPHIPAAALAEMDQVQPYRAANPDDHPLWQLHRLAIEDRHRALVIAFHVATTAMFTAWGPPGNKPNPELQLDGPIANGQQVGHWDLAGDWVQLGFPWSLAFDEAGPAKGGLICPRLLEYSNAVRGVLDRLEPHS